MAKPKRTFSANEGERSQGVAGPDQIEFDLDEIFDMFDPTATLNNGSNGGIDTENMRDGSVTDAILGDRTVDPTLAGGANTGTPTQLLSWITKQILAIKGSGVVNWFDNASSSIAGLWAKFNAVAGHTHTGGADDAPQIGTLGIADGAVTAAKVAADVATQAELQTVIDTVNTDREDLAVHKTSSDHNGQYYTETEVDIFLAGKSGTGHVHTALEVGAVPSVNDIIGKAVTLQGGTGIQIATDAVNGVATITATTEAVPGAHTHDDDEVMISDNVAGVDNTLSNVINTYNEYASGIDVNGIYTIVEYKRRADSTLYLKSTLSNPDVGGNYQTDTWQYYASDGTTLIKTVVWALTYDVNGNVTSRVVSSVV